MPITLTVPGALWLLAAIPLVWLARRFGRTNFNPRQQMLQTVCRSLLLAVLALALARPVISMGSARMSVVYLVDVSHSVSSRAITDAAAQIDAIGAELAPAHSRIVAFGSNAAVIDGTTALRDLAALDPASPKSPVQRDGSDLELALRQARAEILPGHVPKIVLFSDGHPTAGDVTDAMAVLLAEGVPVLGRAAGAARPRRRVGGRHRRGRRGSPPAVSRRRPSRSAASARATRCSKCAAGGRVLASKAVTLAVGMTPVSLDVTFDAPGAQAIEAVLAMSGDPLPANNKLAVEAFVRARPRVLYVESAPASAKYLQGALGQSGFEVVVRPPSGLPTAAADLDPWDVVILSDLARTQIPDQAMIGDWPVGGARRRRDCSSPAATRCSARAAAAARRGIARRNSSG